MIAYFDASALFKLYVMESRSAQAQAWAEAADMLATCEVAYAELVEALWRRVRSHEVDDEAARTTRQQLDDNWPSYGVLRVRSQTAADLMTRHPLRAMDAIHVAAALELADEVGIESVEFVSFDERQRAAALAEGLRVLPEVGPPDDDVTDA